jgi:excisionase family DNA binding protein
MTSDLLTSKEAAEYLKIELPTLYALTSQRKIKFTKPNGNRIYFRKQWLDDYLDAGAVKTQSEIEENANNYVVNGGGSQ